MSRSKMSTMECDELIAKRFEPNQSYTIEINGRTFTDCVPYTRRYLPPFGASALRQVKIFFRGPALEILPVSGNNVGNIRGNITRRITHDLDR
jgi:hypothetical protein